MSEKTQKLQIDGAETLLILSLAYHIKKISTSAIHMFNQHRKSA